MQEQLAWGEPIKKRVWQRIVKHKIQQQAALLEYFGMIDQAKLLHSASQEIRSGDVTNREAYAAKLYFQSLFGEGFSRGADDAINGALNYGYAILLSMLNREIVARGYLTQNGITHRNEYNQYNLACDFMEPFRPLVDRMVLENVSLDFERDDRLLLSDFGNSKVSYRDGQYRVASVVSYYVQDCLNALNKKMPVDSIQSYEST